MSTEEDTQPTARSPLDKAPFGSPVAGVCRVYLNGELLYEADAWDSEWAPGTTLTSLRVLKEDS